MRRGAGGSEATHGRHVENLRKPVNRSREAGKKVEPRVGINLTVMLDISDLNTVSAIPCKEDTTRNDNRVGRVS